MTAKLPPWRGKYESKTREIDIPITVEYSNDGNGIYIEAFYIGDNEFRAESEEIELAIKEEIERELNDE